MNDPNNKPWAIFYKQATENVQDINSSLMKHIELVESENLKLTQALSEMHVDNKEKEASLDDAHKIITRLNDEYNRVMKEYKALEALADELVEENKEHKKTLFEKVKNNTYYEKVSKINESLKSENERLKKEISEYKSSLNFKMNETFVYEKENKENNNAISSLNARIQELEIIIKEREEVLKETEERNEDLKRSLEKKAEEISLLNKTINDINSEKKSNLEEVTKQASNTIKLFYNSINTLPNSANSGQQESGNNLFSGEDFFSILNQENGSIQLFEEIFSKYSNVSLEKVNNMSKYFFLIKTVLMLFNVRF